MILLKSFLYKKLILFVIAISITSTTGAAIGSLSAKAGHFSGEYSGSTLKNSTPDNKVYLIAPSWSKSSKRKVPTCSDSWLNSSRFDSIEAKTALPSIENINKALTTINIQNKSLEMHAETVNCAEKNFNIRRTVFYSTKSNTIHIKNRGNIGYIDYTIRCLDPNQDEEPTEGPLKGYIIYIHIVKVNETLQKKGLGSLLVLAGLYDALRFFKASKKFLPLLYVHAIITHPASEKIFSTLEFTRTANKTSRRFVGSEYICDMVSYQPDKLLRRNGPTLFADAIAKISSIVSAPQDT